MRRVSGRVVIGSPVLPLKSRCSAAGASAPVDTGIPLQNELDVCICVVLVGASLASLCVFASCSLVSARHSVRLDPCQSLRPPYSMPVT